MDKEYLNYMAESLEEEGVESRLGARMRSGMKGLGAMTGGEMESQEYTYVKHAFNNFLRRISVTLNDFAQNVDRLRQFKPSLTPQQQKTIDSIMSLHDMISPSQMKAHQYGTMLQPPNVSRMHPSQSPYSTGLSKVPVKKTAPPGSVAPLSEMVEEGMFTREMDLNKAWASRNPANIISAYLRVLQNEINTFYGDVKKLTGQSAKRALEVLKDVNPLHSRILQTANSVANTGLSAATKGATPSGSPLGLDPEVQVGPEAEPVVSRPKAEPGAVPPVIPGSKPPTPPAPPTAAGSPEAAPAPKGSKTATANDFVALVGEVLKIINDRIAKDEPHSREYFAKPETPTAQSQETSSYYLPKTWEEPAPTEPEWKNIPGTKPVPGGQYKQVRGKWAYEPPAVTEAEKTPEAEPEAGEEDPTRRKQTAASKEEFIPSGNFVYDFASLWDKHRTNWTIRVSEGGGKEITLPNGEKKIIDVYWEWDKHKNNIIVKIRDFDDNKWTQAPLLSFYDDQVNPRSPTYKEEFSIPLFLEQADKRAKNLFNNASNFDAVNKEVEKLKPSLYAVIRRKGPMEFKPKERDTLGLAFIEGSLDPKSEKYGSVQVTKGKNPRVYSKDEVKQHYHSANPQEAETWRKELDALGYFDKLDPEVQEEFHEIESIAQEAALDLQKINRAFDQQRALSLVKDTMKKLGGKVLNMTPDAIANKTAVNNLKIEDFPEIKKAVGALETLGFKHKDAVQALQTVLPDIGFEEDSETYVKAAFANEKEKITVVPPTKTEIPPEKSPGKEDLTQAKMAVQSLMGQGFSAEKSVEIIQKIVDKHGRGLSARKYVYLALHPEEPEKVEPPVSAVTSPVTAPVSEPAIGEPPTAPVSKPTQLDKVNKELEDAGIEKLSNEQELKNFFSLKGAWNNNVKKKLQQAETEEEAAKLEASILGKHPEQSQLRMWKKLVNSAKALKPKVKKSEPPTTQTEVFNPFQRENFLLD